MFLKLTLLCVMFSLGESLSQHPILIVVSYDAFRYNFLTKSITPNMLRLREQGSYVDYLYNVFPTKTFPNHHSIATGLYPENHGVIANSYHDPSKLKVTYFGYEMFHYDETVVPIWRANEDAAAGRYSGIMMWPGGAFPYQNKYATYYKEFESGFDWKKRVDIALSWIEDPDKPANLIMMYFEEPDTHGHVFGPNSQTVTSFLRRLDNITLYLDMQLAKKKLKGKVHVVHLSDHGLVTVKPSGFINVTQHLTPDTFKVAGTTPCLHIIPNEDYENETLNILTNDSLANGHFNVYTKSNMPPKWRFTKNPRIPPILLVADAGYGFQDLAEMAKQYGKRYGFEVTNSSEFGVHGYDNELTDMHPFFMAWGPQIKVNRKVKPFHTVDLYELFCAILRIGRPKTDGSFLNVQDILVDSWSWVPIMILIAGGTLLVLLLVACAAVVTLLIIKRQQSIMTTAALNKRFPQTFNHSNNVIEAQHLLEPEDA